MSASTSKGKSKATDGLDETPKANPGPFILYPIGYRWEDSDSALGYTTSQLDQELCSFLRMDLHSPLQFDTPELLSNFKKGVINKAKAHSSRRKPDIPTKEETSSYWFDPLTKIVDKTGEGKATEILSLGLAMSIRQGLEFHIQNDTTTGVLLNHSNPRILEIRGERLGTLLSELGYNLTVRDIRNLGMPPEVQSTERKD